MNQTTDASAMFAPIWRRKWLILAVAILVAGGTYFYYKRQRPTYLATTQIYLGAGAEEQAQIGGGSSASVKKSSAAVSGAQAALINSAIIKSAVHEQLHKLPKSHTVSAALKVKTKAKAPEKSEFITITAEGHNARAVALAANLTAQTYVRRQNGKYRREVEAAIGLTRRQLRRIEASEEVRSTGAAGGKGGKGTAPSTSLTLQSANLSNKLNQLEGQLAIVNVTQINVVKKKSVQAVSASPKKNAIFGFAVGLLLASFAAYALSRLDDRLRSLAEIEEAFETEILTALRATGNPIVRRDGYLMPSKLLREQLQRLRTTLQVGSVAERPGAGEPRTLLFISSDAGDGRSTVLSDLALVQRDAGEAVAIVEADLRRPALAKLLDVDDRPGLADVLEGRLTVSEVMQSVGAPPAAMHPAAAEAHAGVVATVVEAPATGSASVLVGGAATVADPSSLLAGAKMADTLRSIAQEFDHVLIDAPPPLEVSDVLPLLNLVDGIVIVARVGQTRLVSAKRLVQLLARTPSAPVLGVVANGVSQKDVERYGFSTRGRGWRSKLTGR